MIRGGQSRLVTAPRPQGPAAQHMYFRDTKGPGSLASPATRLWLAVANESSLSLFSRLPSVLDKVFYHTFKGFAIADFLVGPFLPVIQKFVGQLLHLF